MGGVWGFPPRDAVQRGMKEISCAIGVKNIYIYIYIIYIYIYVYILDYIILYDICI